MWQTLGSSFSSLQLLEEMCLLVVRGSASFIPSVDLIVVVVVVVVVVDLQQLAALARDVSACSERVRFFY